MSVFLATRVCITSDTLSAVSPEPSQLYVGGNIKIADILLPFSYKNGSFMWFN
jgi:hypothetical protein